MSHSLLSVCSALLIPRIHHTVHVPTSTISLSPSSSLSLNSRRDICVLPKIILSSPCHHHHHRPTKNKNRVSFFLLSSSSSSNQNDFSSLSFNSDPSPDSRVIQAIETLKLGSPVMASDVASIAGVSLSTARQSLATLAVLTHGSVAVTSEGSLVYTFSRTKTISSLLESKSQSYRLKQIFYSKIIPTVTKSIRVGFGILLYLQILIVFASLFFISASVNSSSSNNNRDDNDNRRPFSTQVNINLFDLRMLIDLLWNTNTNAYYNKDRFTNNNNNNNQKKNLLTFIFSYVFGDDTNPNFNIKDTRLKTATQLIRKNGGILFAEQLIPLLLPQEDNEDNSSIPTVPSSEDTTTAITATKGGDSFYVHENYVLPIVSQLGGEPIVSDQGDILYFFPDLLLSTEASILVDAGLAPNATNLEIKQCLMRKMKMMTMKDPRQQEQQQQLRLRVDDIKDRLDLIQLLEQSIYSSPTSSTIDKKQGKEESDDSYNAWPTPIQKQLIPFNRNDSQSNMVAGLLGVFNLLGTIKLYQMFPILSTTTSIAYRLPVWYSLVQSALPFFLVYAISFNLIPGIRQVINSMRNKNIQQENEKRIQWYQYLLKQPHPLQKYRESSSSNGNSNIIQRKLASAASMRSRIRRLSKDQIIYDSNADFTELKQEKDKSSLDDFDKRLNL